MSQTKGACGFIDDGYTLSETIDAEEGVHPALAIEYRPMLAAEKTRICRQAALSLDGDGHNAEQGQRVLEQAMADHLVSWDMRDRHGEPVKINADSVGRVEPHLSAKLWRVLSQLEDAEEKAKN